ncbi:GMC oxidoreductase [Streptomyces hokutonensis]|uniref:GMC oxidoreductase n=1 Tax=Streptomyces hokutonensis TaxID=1306990 RepID=UPI0036A707A2
MWTGRCTAWRALSRRTTQVFGTVPIMAETSPDPTVRGDREIIAAALDHVRRGRHAVGTRPACPAGDDLVDVRQRVRGVAGLRIVDRSALLSRNLDRRSWPWPGIPPAPLWTRADPAPTL